MRKAIIVALVAMLLPAIGNAQLGGLLQKAARKAVEKTTEKLTDKAAEKASEAAEKALEKEMDARTTSPTPSATEQATYESVMRMLPELPSADQLVKHKEAELNEKTFKLLASNVTKFYAKSMELASQCSALSYADLDSAKVMDMASAYTGLTSEEMEMLSKMSDEEQQAWLQAHYSQERAQTAAMQQAVDASKWLEPLQPMIDKWSAAGEKADAVYKAMDAKLKPIYKKYAEKMSNATGKELVNLTIAYYTEAVPHIRTAVQQAMNIRLTEQLPIAEQIEAEMVKIRAEHSDAISQLLNYPMLTSTQYFTEASRLTDVPKYDD